MKIFYLGAFPPGYGGVTIKNKNLYEALKQNIDILKIDFNLIKEGNWKETLRLIIAVIGRKNRFVIGVSGKKTRKRFTQLLFYFNRNAMHNSVIFLMGGVASKDIASDPEYLKCASGYKKIYAETEGMVKTLEDAGLANVGYYPNGRFKIQEQITPRENKENIKCVFFSTICQNKGVDVLLKAAESLPEVLFALYGKIEEAYQVEFENAVTRLSNVEYKGVFTEGVDAVYRELSKYDILLLPTRYKTEGVPGILVEAKIAGIAIIVSNESYNAELVKDGKEGLVLAENSAEYLISALKKVNSNREFLQNLKIGSSLSAEHFYIENYIDDILHYLRM